MNTSNIYLIWFFFTGSILMAQNGIIKGIIKTEDGILLTGVQVYLAQTEIGTITNAKGHYEIKNIPEGNFTLNVSYLGYKIIKKNVVIRKNSVLKYDFTLIESLSSLDEVTITGGHTGVKNIPGSVSYISPKEIEKYNYTDINRVLQTIPGVNIQEEDGFGLFPSIGLRGTAVERNTKITVMEDGVLMAPAPYAAPAAYYFPTMGRMQGVEVVKGSSQIKYGPYTTGGAINLISTQIPNEFSSKIRLWGGSFNGRNIHATIGNKHKNIAYLVETFQSSSNGFKTIDIPQNKGNEINSGFNKRDYLAKVRINTAENAKIYQSLDFKIGKTSGDINETYLGITQEDFYKNPTLRYAGSQVDNIKTLQNQFSITHKAIFSDHVKLTTTVYKTTFSRNWYKLDKVKDDFGETLKIATVLDNPSQYQNALSIVKGNSSLNPDALFVKANNRTYYSKGIQTTLQFDFKTQEIQHNIDIGLRLHQDQIDRYQWIDKYAMNDGIMQLTDAGIHGTESNRIETADALASYIQYQLKINHLTLTPGIRYENIRKERMDYGTEDPNRTGNDLSIRTNKVSVFIPGIGIDYKFNPNLSSFIGIHKGFSPPGTKEELKPEQSINYELGTRYSKKGISGQVVLFVNDYTNLLGTDLEAAGGGGTNEQFNGGAVKTKGLEFNLTYDILYANNNSAFNLPVSLIYTYTDARFKNSFDSDFDGWGQVSAGDGLPYIAKNRFGFSMALEHKKFNFNLNGRFTDKMRTVPGQGPIPENQKTDAYFILDSGATYYITSNLSVFVNGINLTNKTYLAARRPAGLRPGLPRSLNIGLKATF